MSKNYDQEAHNQGEPASSKSKDRSSAADIISKIFGGKCNPPKGDEEAYKAGYDNDQKQTKK